MKIRSKSLKFLFSPVIFGAVVLLAGFLTFLLHCKPDSAAAEDEQYAVFSAYLAQGLTGESHSLGHRNGELVIDGRTMRWRATIGMVRELWLLKQQSPLSTMTPLLNLLCMSFVREELQRSFALPVKYELMTKAEVALYPTMAFQARFPGNYGYHRFTRVGFNSVLTEAVFYTDHMCGLCGEGKYVFMKKQNGRWVVVGTASRWIS